MLDEIKKNKYEIVIQENKKLQLWEVQPSSSAKNCRNFIREIVDNLNLKPNPEKPVIALSIGMSLHLY